MHHSVCFSLYSWRLSQWAHTIQCSFVLLCLHPSWCNLNIKIPKLMEMLWSDAAVQNKSWCGKKCWLAWSQLCRPFHLSRSRPDSHKPIPLKKKKKADFSSWYSSMFTFLHIYLFRKITSSLLTSCGSGMCAGNYQQNEFSLKKILLLSQVLCVSPVAFRVKLEIFWASHQTLELIFTRWVFLEGSVCSESGNELKWRQAHPLLLLISLDNSWGKYSGFFSYSWYEKTSCI